MPLKIFRIPQEEVTNRKLLQLGDAHFMTYFVNVTPEWCAAHVAIVRINSTLNVPHQIPHICNYKSLSCEMIEELY